MRLLTALTGKFLSSTELDLDPPLVERDDGSWWVSGSVSADALERYVGRYRFEDGSELTVLRDGQQLIVQMTGQGPVPVRATAPRAIRRSRDSGRLRCTTPSTSSC